MANWHIGFTAFGGPAVQFQTVRLFCKPQSFIHELISAQFHEKFVPHLGWIDEPMVCPLTAKPIITVNSFKYQQIFAISQALPGSASTKMLFCINTIHSGFLAGFIAFALFW